MSNTKATDKVVPILSDKVYAVLKDVTQIVLPAAIVFYVSLVGIWDFPHGREVVATLGGFNVFLGALLKLSTGKYNRSGMDGSLTVDLSDAEKDVYKIEVNQSIEELSHKDSIQLKVDGSPPVPPRE